MVLESLHAAFTFGLLLRKAVRSGLRAFRAFHRCSELLRSKVGGLKLSSSFLYGIRVGHAEATSLAWLQVSPTTRSGDICCNASYRSLSRISIISAAVITGGSFGKCLRLPDQSKVSPYCAGWDRLGIAVYSLQLILYSLWLIS